MGGPGLQQGGYGLPRTSTTEPPLDELCLNNLFHVIVMMFFDILHMP